MSAPRWAYPLRMVSSVRVSLCKIALLSGAALLAAGCDTGGLLVVEHKPGTVEPVQGPSVNEMVNGGNFAKNGKYRIFYTLGQPSPNQGVASSPGHQNNGGLVGAAHGD